MKKNNFFTITFITTSISILWLNYSFPAIADINLVPVYSWWNSGDTDSISLRDGEIEDWKLGSWGYKAKAYSFRCSSTPFTNSVAIYRYWHPKDKDWITITENEIPESQMLAWGYTSKTFQCYVSSSPLQNGLSPKVCDKSNLSTPLHLRQKLWQTLFDGGFARVSVWK